MFFIKFLNLILGKVPTMSKDEVNIAIKNSKKVQKEWKLTLMNKRVEVLYKVAEILEE